MCDFSAGRQRFVSGWDEHHVVTDDVPRPRYFSDIAALTAVAGSRLGESRWHRINQRQVDLFAAATGDDQWIHVDPVRASDGPFGGTITHGYLLLALVPRLLRETFEIGGLGMMVNTGVDALRFLSPVPVGAEVRLLADLTSVIPRARGSAEVMLGVGVEMRDRSNPVCRAHVGIILRPLRSVRTPRQRPVAGHAATDYTLTDTARAGS